MKEWFNWRTAIGSIVGSVVLSIALFLLLGRTMSLTGLDLFFIATTLISLGFNLWQLFRDRYKYAPLRNSLIGLFNDLKGRSLQAHQRQQLIISPAGMALPVDAIRLEFYDYVQQTTQSWEQLREHLVAAIHTLDPEATTQEVFRAAEFGLTEQEKTARREHMDRFIQNARAAAANAPQAQSNPPSNTTNGQA